MVSGWLLASLLRRSELTQERFRYNRQIRRGSFLANDARSTLSGDGEIAHAQRGRGGKKLKWGASTQTISNVVAQRYLQLLEVSIFRKGLRDRQLVCLGLLSEGVFAPE